MKSTLTKRITAWIIDIIIVTIILFILSLIYNPDTTDLEQSLNNIMVSYVQKDITFSNYLEQTSIIYKQIDTVNLLLNIINALIIIGYFIILPYFNNGQTIGKKVNAI